VQHRWFVSILSLVLLACAGPARVTETVARPRPSRSAEASKERATPARKASATAARKPRPQGARDAKASFSSESELEEGSGAEAFAGVDTAAPVDSDDERTPQEVAVKGIEGTMSEYDVRSVLESRNEDFDRCHDRAHGGSGRIEFRIHILSNGDVGDVKVHRSKVRSRELVECYTDVVATSKFALPHGGYADVKWTTKVGRSRTRPDAVFERKVRWDTPATGGVRNVSAEPSDSESRRERRRARRQRKGA